MPAASGSEEHQLDFTPLAFIDIAPNIVALVSKGEGSNTDYSCHACDGAMTMHYLKRGPQGFVVLGHWRIDSGGANYGAVNPWTIRTDLDDSPTMLISGEYMGMGCEIKIDTLVALTPTGPEERGSFTLSSSYDGEVAAKNYKYEGKLVPEERGKTFAVEYSGSAPRRLQFTKGTDRVFRPEHPEDLSFPPKC
jgi:hypothetical protein